MPESNERLLFEHLGERALSFLLAVDPDTLRLRLEDGPGNPLSEAQEGVLSRLVLLDQDTSGWLEGEYSSYSWIERLGGRTEPDAPTSTGNCMRTLAGGALSSPPADGPYADRVLVQLAHELYPGFLVKETDDPFARHGLTRSLLSHPLNVKYQDLVMQDAVLSRLFPDESESGGKSGNTIRSTGQGGSHQLWLFAEMLLLAAWTLARLRSSRPSIEEFSRACLEASQIVRKAVRGKTTSVPIRVGLAGVLIPSDIEEIDFTWAKVRLVDARDDRFVRGTSIEGQLSASTPEGEKIVINYSGDLVLELDIPFLIKLGKRGSGSPWPEDLKVGFQIVDQVVENLRLGLLLSMADRRVVLYRSWQVTFDPLVHGGSGIGWNDLKQAVGLMPTQLTADEVASWVTWSKKIEEHRTPSISVAIRRMLAAVAERHSPDDVLVDSVIVWENLFGAPTETTLRVTSSLAWLLGSSAEDRKSRQKAYKNLYRLRSDIVHGNATIKHSEIQEKSGDAVAVAIDALREIFDRRPELLTIPSSEGRSLEVLHAGSEQVQGRSRPAAAAG